MSAFFTSFILNELNIIFIVKNQMVIFFYVGGSFLAKPESQEILFFEVNTKFIGNKKCS
ncbi:hypothetical protein GAGA_0942 [Paraglaciecola agarilytica NO2]|uniref:Uncharacterized protein n=1 Tax=Paraglaciecola agarilytica NO2 TaxID=1125747 RepID=A0ABQ0I3B1_9ALTE|nr:hypothetical protein GAGA_0942 [Paraglaciecola agarilytica NO2]